MDAYKAIVNKRDQRAFLARPISEDALERILQSGRMTGSSKNREPNRFVVVRDRQRLAAIAALSGFARWMADAAVAIVIAQTERHDFDAGRCAQNMMLAAWNEGVASCPNGMPDPARTASVLGLDDDERPVIVLTFGYPARRRDPESRTPEEWSTRADRKPLDALVSRV